MDDDEHGDEERRGPVVRAGPAWSDDNIRAIASEYTSKPWDDVVLEAGGYPQFVLDAVNDVRRSGVFR